LQLRAGAVAAERIWPASPACRDQLAVEIAHLGGQAALAEE